MSISKISTNLKSGSIKFKNNEKVSQDDQTQPKKTINKKAVALCGLSALAAVTIGIMLLKGKNRSVPIDNPDALQEFLSDAEMKCVDLDLFKQKGKFDKGKAFFDGKPYTGKIDVNDGCRITYNKGNLALSETFDDFGDLTSYKVYDSSGRLHFSRNYMAAEREVAKTFVDFDKDGSWVRTEIKRSALKPDGLMPDALNTSVIYDADSDRLLKIERDIDNVFDESKDVDSWVLNRKTTNLKTGSTKFDTEKFKPRKLLDI